MTTSHKRILLAIQCVPGKDDDLIQWTKSIRSGNKQERLKEALRFAIAAENEQPSILDRIEEVLTEQADRIASIQADRSGQEVPFVLSRIEDRLAVIQAEQEAVQSIPALRAIAENTSQLLDSVDALDKLTSDLVYRVGQVDQPIDGSAIADRLHDLTQQLGALRSELASGAYSTQNSDQQSPKSQIEVTPQVSEAELKQRLANIARSSSSW